MLWARGAATVREVHEELKDQRKTGYTTVLKLMQIMTEKGLVERDVSRRSHVYRALVSEAETQTRLVDDLVSKAFGGSTTRLVMRALSARATSADELSELRRLLTTLERERDAGGEG